MKTGWFCLPRLTDALFMSVPPMYSLDLKVVLETSIKCIILFLLFLTRKDSPCEHFSPCKINLF